MPDMALAFGRRKTRLYIEYRCPCWNCEARQSYGGQHCSYTIECRNHVLLCPRMPAVPFENLFVILTRQKCLQGNQLQPVGCYRIIRPSQTKVKIRINFVGYITISSLAQLPEQNTESQITLCFQTEYALICVFCNIDAKNRNSLRPLLPYLLRGHAGITTHNIPSYCGCYSTFHILTYTRPFLTNNPRNLISPFSTSA